MSATGTTEPGELGVALEVPSEPIGTPLAPPELGLPRRRADKVFWICVGWMVLMAFFALFANFLPLANPNNPTAQPALGPSLAHPFGTDTVGYDLFSLSLHGARMSMLIGISSAVVGVLIGGSIGVIAGYFKGFVDQGLSWFVDVMLAFPALVFALAIVSFVGASTTSVVVAIAALSVPGYARVARAVTFTYSEADFVMASRALGAKSHRIVVREIVPNVAVSLLSFAALGAAIAIIAEGSLAFLGLGAPSVVSWGNMILQGQQQLTAAPQAALAPMAMMFFTIVSLNFIGERLGAVIDPREGQL
jgi:peptide/nickel transport system permease protein